MDNTFSIAEFLGKRPRQQFSMHEASRELAIPYASFYRAAQKLDGVLCTERVGPVKRISLDFTDPRTLAYLLLASEQRKEEFLKQHPALQKLHDKLTTEDVVLLFGSYAKGKQGPRSDVDLLIINRKGERTQSFQQHEQLYKQPVHALFVSEREFREMLCDSEENVGKQALQHHVVLRNPKRLWELVTSVTLR